MGASNLTQWILLTLCCLLAIPWVWRWLRGREGHAIGAGEEAGESPAGHPEQADAEDVLKAAYAQKMAAREHEKQGGLRVENLARASNLSRTQVVQGVKALTALGWLEEDAQGVLQLTQQGESRAQELTRAHRLWERYLVDREGMPMEAVHDEAHRREHTTTREDLEQLDAELGYPAWDPHGHAIPGPECGLPSSPGQPLSKLGEPGDRLRIVCLNDDSPPLLAQLLALGLKPGVHVEVVKRESDVVKLRIDGSAVPLASAAADRISVVAAPALPLELGRLPVGARAHVVDIKGSGKHQRRMLDMGFVPGADVTVVRKASLGDPVEYRIKGTGIAMRRSDANSILVEEVEHA